MTTKNYIAIVFTVLLLVFAIQNSNDVEINFLFWSTNINLSLLIISSFILGGFIKWLISFRNKVKKVMN